MEESDSIKFEKNTEGSGCSKVPPREGFSEAIWSILETVCDPEVPVLTIIDLGIVRAVNISNSSSSGDGGIEVIITPTYTGCPAMDMITMDIKMKLLEHGYKNIKVTHILSPAWTTEWMSEEGKRKLKEYGIAAPDKKFTIPKDGVECPQCNSTNTKLLSEFGSTACKALYQCNDCKEPFDYFKCH
jgi:ring-1,2-phenylacetyl-CoA epoxidase subunit PaaD